MAEGWDVLGPRGFLRVVETGSISQAARELGVPRATLSRKLSAIEDEVGLPLLARSTRKVAPTGAGEQFYAHMRQALAGFDDAVAAVQTVDDVPRGLLRITAPSTRDPGVERLLVTYMRRYPDVQLESVASGRHMDLLGEGVDVALRAGVRRVPPELVERKLGTFERILVASPAYLEEAPPATVEQLHTHAALVGYQAGHRPEVHWPLRDGTRVRVQPRLAANEPSMLRRAAIDGLGIALLPGPFVLDDLHAGRLVPVLPTDVGDHGRISLLYAAERRREPKIRAFVELALKELEAPNACPRAMQQAARHADDVQCSGAAPH